MKQPNILFLLSDEHSHRFMGHVPRAAGGEEADTPTFDRLASEGTVFTDAYCQMPLCTPSRISLLTGLEVRRSGAWTNCSVLRPELPTMARSFADAGYETCLVGKMHLGGTQQFVGFKHRPYGDLTGKCGHQREPIGPDDGALDTMRRRTAKAVGVTEIPESLIQDEVVAQETVSWLREQDAASPDQPWFLCASFSRPHFPLTAPKRHIDRYPPDAISEPMVPASGDAYDHPMSAGMRKGFKADDIDHDEMMKARASYFACVSYIDEVIGDLLVRLEAAGLLEDTIIVYTTDHGEMAGEHGVWWKNGWYEACTRVPLIFSMPDQRRGDSAANRCETPVALLDLHPTLCSMAGVDHPDDLDGSDLSGAIAGGDAPERPIFCDNLTPRWGEGTEFRSIRWRRWKYVVFRDCDALMFDLESDPSEQANLLTEDLTGDAADARSYLEKIAAESIDFNEAERERTDRDGSLPDDYRQKLPPSTGNLYLMPSGQLVNADTVLYSPEVIAERPSEAFGDCPQDDD